MQAIGLRKSALAVAATMAVAAVALVAVAASPAAGQQTVTYNVTIENLTSGQPFTPPVVAAHTSGMDVFEVGQAASAEVQAIAENGNNDPLVALLGGSAAVLDSATGTAPVKPGESATITVEAPSGSLLSVVFMLICTNDGFSGVDSMTLAASGSESVDANAYDAGTETNTEDFADIVPPCQDLIGVSSADAGTGETNPALAEGGVITAHSGIQGGTDLTVSDHGWTDPVARITVVAEAAGLPDSGGAPPAGSSGGLWALYLSIAGAALLIVGGGAFFVASRRPVR
ncbi:MAG: spondin domain-containing protein [Chloroflexi bacterium]|nr:spondin domain-containing protein [Chloroflexota bacterium]